MRRRVLQHDLGRWFDPAAAFVALDHSSPGAFWLDGGADAATGMSYLGTSSRVVTSGDVDGAFLDFLRQQLAQDACEPSAGLPGFSLGWVGWLGYELRKQTMGVAHARASRYPDAAFMFVDRALAFDHQARTVTALALTPQLLALPWPTAAEPSTLPTTGASATWRHTDDQYLSMIRDCQAAIVEGDAYQLCLTTEASVAVTPDPVATYLSLRANSPTHHGAYLRMAGVSVLSSSPERFLSVQNDGRLESRPIKGTRRRGADAAEDSRLVVELRESAKERAENLMIVDLMRNDIGRVSAVGSVSVPELLAVETYAQVHQLVSTVRGVLADGLTAVDAVAACFPAGSMTGAPKLAATAILDRLEGGPRGIFSGALGYFGLDGAIDLAMVIRTIVLDRSGATVGAGGGITALSVPAEELDEVKLKAAALLAVLGVAEQTTSRAV